MPSLVARAAVFAIVTLLLIGCSAPTSNSTSRPIDASTEPDEPCTVEAADAGGRAAAQNWCQGGVFTRVNLSTDASNFVAGLQFSKKGFQGFTNNRFETLNRFRRVADEIAEKTDMNVAFSLHDPTGQLVGGCARARAAVESLCK